jgi:hypothetical protein
VPEGTRSDYGYFVEVRVTYVAVALTVCGACCYPSNTGWLTGLGGVVAFRACERLACEPQFFGGRTSVGCLHPVGSAFRPRLGVCTRWAVGTGEHVLFSREFGRVGVVVKKLYSAGVAICGYRLRVWLWLWVAWCVLLCVGSVALEYVAIQAGCTLCVDTCGPTCFRGGCCYRSSTGWRDFELGVATNFAFGPRRMLRTTAPCNRVGDGGVDTSGCRAIQFSNLHRHHSRERSKRDVKSKDLTHSR